MPKPAPSTASAPSTATAPAPAPNRLVAALLYDDLCTFEFGMTAEIFALQRPEMGADWYRFTTCAQKRTVRACGGVTISAQRGLDALAEAGTIVIPGWTPSRQPPDDALAEALLCAHARGARLVTICTGAFLVAELGLLDGRRATTHWRYAEEFQMRYPAVRLDPDVLYIDEEDVLTSAGSAAGIDLLLHLVRKDFGADASNKVARRLVMAPLRDGGQAQFIERPVPRSANDRLAPLLEAVRKSPAERWAVSRMAAMAMMGERTFLRRFAEATGQSPGEWLTGARLEAACSLLETSDAGLAEVAELSGFGSLATLQHHFRKRLGTAPSAYRARFRTRSAGAAREVASNQ